MSNLLQAIKLIVENPIIKVKDYYTGRNRANSVGEALENYVKAIQIESRTLGEMIVNQIIPACIEYQNKLITNVKGLKEIGLENKFYEAQTTILKGISESIDKLISLEKEMHDLRVKANNTTEMLKQANLYSEKVRPVMSEIREIADHLETIVDDELWPLPKYREMLFSK